MSRIKTIGDEQKRRLVEEWDRSGLSSDAFGESRGIRGATLQAWGRAIRGPLRRPQTRPAQRTLEIVELGTAQKRIEPRIELVLASGRRVQLFAEWTPDVVASFIAKLETIQ